MRVCLLCPEPTEWADVRPEVEALAETLAAEHEVAVVRTGAEPADPPRFDFACPDHRHAAVALEEMRAIYGEAGPDYLEVPDFRAHGLVALQARLGGDPLLRETTIAVRTIAPTGLICLHDGTLRKPGRRRIAALEREQLRLADRVVWPGGDSLDVQRRHRPDLAWPPAVRIPVPAPAAAQPPRREPGGPLRLLYLGPLQRHLGALDLVEACLGLPGDEWELTLCGEDTETGGMGQSARLVIEAMSGGDDRIQLRDSLGPGELERHAGEFDLLVVPSRFQAASRTTLAAMACGLPVLATPVGVLSELVEPGVDGWHADGVGAPPLRRSLARLLEDRRGLGGMRETGAPARSAHRLAGPEPAREAYRRLLGEARPSPSVAVTSEEPLVTGVVPYFAAAAFVRDAVDSLLGQTHRNLEVVIVNDGSFTAADSVLAELARSPRVRVVTQTNKGESAARNLGVLLARGEYVAMLDADNMLEPTFVERALATHRREPSLAYVSCWLRKVDVEGGELLALRGYAALGNGALPEEEEENWDGDTLALLPRSLLAEVRYEEHGSMHNDWGLYRAFREAGLLGTVIPEPLARYRVSPGSLSHGRTKVLRRGWEELEVWNGLRRTRWTAEGTG
ncbi:MAG TPA: glycosyltransferase [Solirubrobacterales bacterium]